MKKIKSLTQWFFMGEVQKEEVMILPPGNIQQRPKTFLDVITWRGEGEGLLASSG